MDPRHEVSRGLAAETGKPSRRPTTSVLSRTARGPAGSWLPAPIVFAVTLALLWFAAAALAHDEPSGSGVPVITSRNMELVAHFNDYPHPSGGRGYNSCWAYIHEDGREYAILGARDGAAIYNITDPSTAYEVDFIPGPSSVWRGARAYRHWIYLVTEGVGPSPAPGLQIVRMTDPENPVLVATYTGSFIRAHTISVDTTRALLFLNGTRNAAGLQNGLVIMSLADPENPVELVAWPGFAMTGVDSLYVHDSVPFGNLLYASTTYAGTMRVLDITVPSNPVIVSQFSYPGGFTHSSAPDTSGRYHYLCDEAPGEPVKVFDVSDLGNPQQLNVTAGDPNAIVHNAYVDGDTLYLANFSRGVRLLDVSDPAHPAEFAWADMRQEELGFFYSVWNVCPFFPSRSVIASDMENGLFVYRPLRDFGILRIEVVDAGNGQPIEGATLTLTTQGDVLETPASGVGRFAPNPGIHTVQIDKFGYVSDIVIRPVVQGARDTVVVSLAAQPIAGLSGVVRDALTLQPLGDAEIMVAGAPLALRTDPSGSFQLPTLPIGDYMIEVKRPGYAPLSLDLTVSSAVAQDFLMTPALTYDPLETDTGWSVGSALDDATAGVWTRVDPIGTGVQPAATVGEVESFARQAVRGHVAAPAQTRFSAGDRGASVLHDEHDLALAFYPHAIQPENDRTPDPGTQCFVTGQGTVPEEYWAGNVDQGQTTLISPALDLTGKSEPSIAYWRWFYSDGDGDDWMVVAISNDDGASWTPVDTLRGIHNRWEEHAIRVTDHLAASDQMRLRFEVRDGGGGSMVEGAIDDLITFDAATVPLSVDPAAIVRLRLRAPWPNPARGDVRLALELPRQERLSVEVLDLAGRHVRTVHDGEARPGLLTVRWDGTNERQRLAGPGLYFVRAVAGAEIAVARIVRLR